MATEKEKTFKAMLRDSGNGSYEVTVPKKLCEYLGMDVGSNYEFAIMEREKASSKS